MIKSSIKRLYINKLRNKINSNKKSMLKTYIKKVKLNIKNKNKELALKNFLILQSILDKLSFKKIIHFNKCSRYKSKIYKLINNLN